MCSFNSSWSIGHHQAIRQKMWVANPRLPDWLQSCFLYVQSHVATMLQRYLPTFLRRFSNILNTCLWRLLIKQAMKWFFQSDCPGDTWSKTGSSQRLVSSTKESSWPLPSVKTCEKTHPPLNIRHKIRDLNYGMKIFGDIKI